ncbi:hypothetical protein L6R52_11705 [Myxococcota bacterium]|nr:hypothetical protein [Myxococcota bacterium]
MEQQIEDQIEAAVQTEAEDDEVRGGIVGPAPEKAAKALEVAQGLADKMGMPSRVSVRDEHERIVVVIEEVEGSTAVAEILGASRPPAIPSFQFLLNKIVNRFPEGRKHILVEVPSVPRRANERKPRPQQAAAPQASMAAPPAPRPLDPDLDPTLVAIGRLLGERAKLLGKVITVHPMLAADRRAVHQTITTIPGVHTMSEGDGIYRRMHIVPDSLKGALGGKRRRRRRRRGRRGDAGAPEGAELQDAGGDDAGDEGEES